MKNVNPKTRDRFLLVVTVVVGIAFVTSLALLLADAVKATEPAPTSPFVTTDHVTNFPYSLLNEDKK